jgi:hypothetical protein
MTYPWLVAHLIRAAGAGYTCTVGAGGLAPVMSTCRWLWAWGSLACMAVRRLITCSQRSGVREKVEAAASFTSSSYSSSARYAVASALAVPALASSAPELLTTPSAVAWAAAALVALEAAPDAVGGRPRVAMAGAVRVVAGGIRALVEGAAVDLADA